MKTRKQATTWKEDLGCVVILLLIVGSIWLVTFLRHKAEAERLAPIVSDVYQLVDVCQSMDITDSISIQGKALVWDVESDKLSEAHFRLSEDLRASIADSRITVFMITDIQRVLVGRYTFANAYRQYAKICVVYWPEKEVVGMTTIASLDPPEKRQLGFTSEYGNLDIPIANWIESLPVSE